MVPMETDPERRKLAVAYIRSLDELVDARHALSMEVSVTPPEGLSESQVNSRKAVLAVAIKLIEKKIDTYLGLIQHSLIPLDIHDQFGGK